MVRFLHSQIPHVFPNNCNFLEMHEGTLLLCCNELSVLRMGMEYEDWDGAPA